MARGMSEPLVSDPAAWSPGRYPRTLKRDGWLFEIHRHSSQRYELKAFSPSGALTYDEVTTPAAAMWTARKLAEGSL